MLDLKALVRGSPRTPGARAAAMVSGTRRRNHMVAVHTHAVLHRTAL